MQWKYSFSSAEVNKEVDAMRCLHFCRIFLEIDKGDTLILPKIPLTDESKFDNDAMEMSIIPHKSDTKRYEPYDFTGMPEETYLEAVDYQRKMYLFRVQ